SRRAPARRSRGASGAPPRPAGSSTRARSGTTRARRCRARSCSRAVGWAERGAPTAAAARCRWPDPTARRTGGAAARAWWWSSAQQPLHHQLFRPVFAAPRQRAGDEAGVAAARRDADLHRARRRFDRAWQHAARQEWVVLGAEAERRRGDLVEEADGAGARVVVVRAGEAVQRTEI